MKRNILTTVLVTLCFILGFNSCTAKIYEGAENYKKK